MIFFEIECPSCGKAGKFSLADTTYDGPYRCWKCRSLFSVKIEDNQLVSCEPLDEAAFEKQQEIEQLRKQYRRG